MRRILPLIFSSLIVHFSFAQDIIYTVSGELNEEKVFLDSILVENLSNNTWITFNNLPEELYYQINLTKKAYWGTTSVSSLDNNLPGFVEAQNMPGELTLTYNNTVPTKARFSVFSINGQEIYSSTKQTLLPGNSVQVKLAETGVFLIRVESDLGTQSFKGIGLPNNNNYDVSVIDKPNFKIQTKSAQTTFDSDFEYSVGDSVRVSVYKTENYASPIYVKVINSEFVNFMFEDLSDTTLIVTGGNIDLEVLSGLNIQNMKALSMNDIENVNFNGSFQLKNKTDKTSLDPLLFLDGEDMLFGYIPNSTNNNNIEIEEILSFFYLFFPGIESLNLPYEELKEIIKNEQNHEELKLILINSLNNNLPPLENPIFISKLKESAYNIFDNLHIETKSANVSEEFKINYTRDGNISWPKKSDAFCYLGLEIQKDGKPVSEHYLIKANELKFSFVKLLDVGVSWIADLMKDEQLPPSYKMNSDGNYTVVITNGKNRGTESKPLYDKIVNTNRDIMIADALSLIIPFLAKKSVLSKCNISLYNAFVDLMLEQKKTEIKGEANEITFYRKIFLKSHEIVTECISNPTEGLMIDEFFKIAKALDATEKIRKISNIIVMLGDSYFSEYNITENRIFYNNYSTGEIEYKNQSFDNKFVGIPTSEHKFKSTIKEKSFTYNLDRNASPNKFVPSPDLNGVEGFTFSASILNGGDATITKTLPIKTNILGEFELPVTMGRKSSEILITPEVSNIGIPTETIVFEPLIPEIIEIVKETDNQIGEPNKALKELVKVFVKDKLENKLVGIKVDFAPGCQDCGNVTNPNAITVEQVNYAGTGWYLGNKLGSQTLKVKLPDYPNVPEVEIQATAIGPSSLKIISENPITSEPNMYIVDPLKVEVLDNQEKPFHGAEIVFSIECTDCGSLSKTNVSTGPDGIARTNWTLGKLNKQKVTAKIKGYENIPSVEFVANVFTNPTVNTLAATEIKQKEVKLNGNVTSDGGTPITQRGFYYSSTNNTPDSGDNIVSVSGTTGNFAKIITNLTPNTTYYFSAFATNTVGTGVGDILSFKTLEEVDSISIYTQAVIGTWDRKRMDEHDWEYEVLLLGSYEGSASGYGTYSQVGEVRYWFDIKWSIYKKDGRYYLDPGIYRGGRYDSDPLTFPINGFNQYDDEGKVIFTYKKVK